MRDSVSVIGRPFEHPSSQHDLVRHRYRAYAPHYDRRFRRYSAWSRAHVLDAIGVGPEPRRILDACCGTGIVTAALADRFPAAEVFGIDLSHEMLACAHERLEALSLGTVHLKEAPAERLPVDSESIDLLVCANAFHLIDRQQPAMEEFARVLAPGGRAVIFDWTRESIPMRLLLHWLLLTQKTRRRVHTCGSLVNLARHAGLDAEVAQRAWIPPAWSVMTVQLRKPSAR